ncbi:MAG: hypothetical protein RR585_04355 [Coprobacillus sp.]
MKKKKMIISVLAAVMLLIGGYQITVANFNQNGAVNTKISAGELGIEIVDFDLTVKKDSLGQYQFLSALPGSTMTRQVGIENVKDKELYARVTVTRYWTDGQNNKITDAEAAYINILTEQTGDWIVMNDSGSNQERIIFYYKQPINAGQKTSPFMDAIQLDEGMSNQAYSKYHANIKVEAEAIQKVGATDAMLSQWGVDATFDSQGNIETIVE